MENTSLVRRRRAKAALAGMLLGIIAHCGCAGPKDHFRVSQYRFDVDDEIYRIRSIATPDNGESYNEIIGRDFMAADFDQDGIVDRILLGQASLSEAQRVYEHGLKRVTAENRLQVRNPRVNRYVHENNDFLVEISSFRPSNARPFNEFKITDQRPLVHPLVIVILDHDADGTLDEVLKGAEVPENAQSQYAKAIETGLSKRELVKVDNLILVAGKGIQ